MLLEWMRLFREYVEIKKRVKGKSLGIIYVYETGGRGIREK